jgi:iron complex outermembrane receptor protein
VNSTSVNATFGNALTPLSPFNPFATPTAIFLSPGDHLTGIPNLRFKAGGSYQVNNLWKIGADLDAIGSQYLVGDESSRNPRMPARRTVNLHSSY